MSKRAAALERELSQQRLQIARHAAAASLEQPLPLQQIQADLPDDLTVVCYHVAGDEIFAFIITHEAVKSVRHLSSPTAIQSQLNLLAAQWRHLKGDSDFVERHIHRLVQNAERPLHQLYVELVASLEPLLHLHEVDFPAKLVLVPHGLLHQVPFQALHDGERYLIESTELSYAPSASIMTLGQRRQQRESLQMLVLGVTDPAIPAVEVETRAIARVLPFADVRMEEAATVDALLRTADTYGGIHFACHGIFRTDNPNFSALKLHDGWLTADEATHLDLDGALVVLSACESGRSGVLAGDETIGLTRAFLGAGAATVVVSHWLVQDDTGAMLMAEWYARLARGQDATTALRAAQLAIMSSHPHPYHLGAFCVDRQQNCSDDLTIGVSNCRRNHAAFYQFLANTTTRLHYSEERSDEYSRVCRLEKRVYSFPLVVAVLRPFHEQNDNSTKSRCSSTGVCHRLVGVCQRASRPCQYRSR